MVESAEAMSLRRAAPMPVGKQYNRLRAGCSEAIDSAKAQTGRDIGACAELVSSDFPTVPHSLQRLQTRPQRETAKIGCPLRQRLAIDIQRAQGKRQTILVRQVIADFLDARICRVQVLVGRGLSGGGLKFQIADPILNSRPVSGSFTGSGALKGGESLRDRRICRLRLLLKQLLRFTPTHIRRSRSPSARPCFWPTPRPTCRAYSRIVLGIDDVPHSERRQFTNP